MTDWGVPPDLFEAVADGYGPFSLILGDDPAALERPWAGERVWVYPPSGGAGARPWLEKAALEARAGATVVCLLPFAAGTAWWHELVDGQAEVRPVLGRIRFVGSRSPAPFPSALAVYRPPLLAHTPKPKPATNRKPALQPIETLELFGLEVRTGAPPGTLLLVAPNADPRCGPSTTVIRDVRPPADPNRRDLEPPPPACVRCNGTGVIAPSKAWDFDDQREHDPCPVCCTHRVCPTCPASLQRLEASSPTTAPAGPEP